MDRSSPPIALTIAGSDCSSGAGVQADLKTFSAFGVYGLTAVTCIVAEVPGCVSTIYALPAKAVCAQMKLLLRTYDVRAIKTGMLHTGSVIEAVAEVCRDYRNIPLVIDPVITATTGDALLQRDAVELYCECLFPLASLVTPNLSEARVLLAGHAIDTPADMAAAGIELSRHHRTAFLMKGGHLDVKEAVDLLCRPDGTTQSFHAPFTRGVSTHGTGCTYSAAITAGLAQRVELAAAVAQAKRYVTAAIEKSFRWPHGAHKIDALNHWAEGPLAQA